jgi:hypothetical protein
MGQQEGTDTPSHSTGTAKGEETTATEGKEAGRYEEEETGADRPTGGSTPRDSTGINADDEEPIDPESPHYPAP